MLDAHFRAIADEGGLPIVVYNVPSRTGTNVEADTFLRLAEHPRVAAVKEASGNIEQLAVICRDRPRDVAVLAGDDARRSRCWRWAATASSPSPATRSRARWRRCRRGARRRLGRRPAHPRPMAAAVPGELPGCAQPRAGQGRALAMGLIERDDTRAPLLPLDDAPRARLTDAAAHARPRRRRGAAATADRADRPRPGRPRRDGAA